MKARIYKDKKLRVLNKPKTCIICGSIFNPMLKHKEKRMAFHNMCATCTEYAKNVLQTKKIANTQKKKDNTAIGKSVTIHG